MCVKERRGPITVTDPRRLQQRSTVLRMVFGWSEAVQRDCVGNLKMFVWQVRMPIDRLQCNDNYVNL
jgi:hypothetical protein